MSSRSYRLPRKDRRLVRDEATGRVGELQAICDYHEPSRIGATARRLAFIRPLGGGREWTTTPDYLTALTPEEYQREAEQGWEEPVN
ncbi:hypothetical protein [Streptomyces sp. NPDC005438]|uniref:hypothetical protein n=1 Tax=Streptomyces sp. NPDC005438 TaxID=3156880 RepID=UPI0033A4EE86